MRSFRLRAFLAFALPSLICVSAFADEKPLHQRIDALIEAKATTAKSPLGKPIDDATFLRRTSLDFTGRIPSAAETRAFLADTAADKRTKLIDHLLADPNYASRMKDLFHVMLMERRGEDPNWTRFLETSFAENKPWDRMVAEMLFANTDDEKTRGAAFFQTKRLEKYGQNATDFPGLTRDVARLFLGVDLQCAQCHDHPSIDDYKQNDFNGLYVVFLNTSIRRNVKFPAISEKVLAKKLDFVSVFTMDKGATGPRLPFGMEVEIPVFKKGEEYSTPPDRKAKTPGVLKFSPLKVLSERMPRPETRRFSKNIANRLWFAMMGRGIEHPLDLANSENPPSHPELLDLLADEMASHAYDIKWLLHELALTKTYQRSSRMPEGVERSNDKLFTVSIERRLTADQVLISMLTATGELKRIQARKPAEKSKEDAPAEDAPEADLTFDEIRKEFIAAFGNTPREPEVEFAPSLRSALFISNGDILLDLLQPRDGNLVDRLAKTTDANAFAEEAYLSVLTRLPTDEERKAVTEYLAKQADRTKAARNLAWSLLASTEFCVNH
jgi:hypothetical protein